MRTKQPLQAAPHACLPAGRFVLRADSFPIVSDCAPALSTCCIFRRRRPLYVPQRVCGRMERKGLRLAGRRIAVAFSCGVMCKPLPAARKAAYRREGIRKRKIPPASRQAGRGLLVCCAGTARRDACCGARPRLCGACMQHDKKLNPPHAGHGPAG